MKFPSIAVTPVSAGGCCQWNSIKGGQIFLYYLQEQVNDTTTGAGKSEAKKSDN
jgi:hypothetical protein